MKKPQCVVSAGLATAAGHLSLDTFARLLCAMHPKQKRKHTKNKKNKKKR